MEQIDIRTAIATGQTTIGIELGSTRIKTVLIGPDHQPLATGAHDWENQFVDGYWTYALEAVWAGIQDSYADMARAVRAAYGLEIHTVGAIGCSGMMHGYLPFDTNGQLLTPFRTWRNNTTATAATALAQAFAFPIPQRWSIAHLYQAILDGEAHVPHIASLTTLAGYVHRCLTGENVLGTGEASGVFPIDAATLQYDPRMLQIFAALVKEHNLPWQLSELLPQIRGAGEPAGRLSEEGARRLDAAGHLQAGAVFCPPEGDAGTGMVATNRIAPRTGNVSAGTSVFAMIVLEKPLARVHPEIDLVTTPTGQPVAMVHANNCTSDYDAWIGLFAEALQALGGEVSKSKLYDTLLGLALTADADGGGLLSYGYVAGEHITDIPEGRPLFARGPAARFTLANFMRTQLFAALGALRIGLEILQDQEGVQVDEILGHGGFFKTPEVGQRMMAAAVRVPVSVMATAGEGGAWGIALLAAYRLWGGRGESLETYLTTRVFAGQHSARVAPTTRDVEGFDRFMQRYRRGLALARAAGEHLD